MQFNEEGKVKQHIFTADICISFRGLIKQNRERTIASHLIEDSKCYYNITKILYAR